MEGQGQGREGQGREGQGQGLNLWDCVQDGKALLRSCCLCVEEGEALLRSCCLCVEDGKALLRSCCLCVEGDWGVVWIEQLGVLDGEGFDLCAGV